MSLPDPWNSYIGQIASASNAQEVEAIRLQIFGRKSGALTMAMKDLAGRSAEEKRELGKLYNDVKQALESALDHRLGELSQAQFDSIAETDKLDATLNLPKRERGHLHLIHEYIRSVQEVFGRMGFDAAEGPELENEAMQFDLLNFPKEHAARDAQDIFYIHGDAPPDNRLLLRGHTSTVQIRYMQGKKPPFRMICTGKVYRRDADATHSPMFHQIEGLMVGRDVSLANMKGVMETAVKELIGADTLFRWRTGYFPFVEPGLEMDVGWKGDASETKEGKWLEVVGCGMVHPNVLKNCGIDPGKWQGFAFGFGVERMLMIKHRIPDLRAFFQGDLRFLRQFC